MLFGLLSCYSSTLLLCLTGFAIISDARMMSKGELHMRQVEAAKRFNLGTRATSAGSSGQATAKNITFANPKASRASSHTYLPLS
jgi:carboxypeptidase D